MPELPPWKVSISPFMKRKPYAILFCVIFFVQNLIFAQEAKLTNIIVTNTRDDLLVYLSVEDAFREQTKKAILSGVPTTFSFFITLYRPRNLWLDNKIAAIKATSTVKYNNLKKEFAQKS